MCQATCASGDPLNGANWRAKGVGETQIREPALIFANISFPPHKLQELNYYKQMTVNLFRSIACDLIIRFLLLQLVHE